jgi:hypothetical protein
LEELTPPHFDGGHLGWLARFHRLGITDELQPGLVAEKNAWRRATGATSTYGVAMGVAY